MFELNQEYAVPQQEKAVPMEPLEAYVFRNGYSRDNRYQVPTGLTKHEVLQFLEYGPLPRLQLSAKSLSFDFFFREVVGKTIQRRYAVLQTHDIISEIIFLDGGLAELNYFLKLAADLISSYQSAKRG